jgi:UDP:flavonoid glycosyltransferase YjiC (YdhE family)
MTPTERSTIMVKALFVTWDGGGNLPPALGIAAELVRRGGFARFLGHESQRAAIEAAGFAFAPIQDGDLYSSTAPRGTLSGIAALTRIFSDRSIGRLAVTTARATASDVVVVDCLLAGATEVVLQSGLPTVGLVHSLLSYFEGNARGPIGGIVRLRGARMTAALRSPTLALVTARPEFESFGRRGAPANARHVGVVWNGTPVASRFHSDRPRILVSLSTTVFPGQEHTLQSIIDALESLPVDATVTTGPSIDPGRLRAPAHIAVRSFGDHTELLRDASLLIGHGGHGTTMRALSAGVPVLVLPMHPLMDQPAIGRAVERLGVGRMLSRSSSLTAIRSAVLPLLEPGLVREAAAALGASIREHDGAARAADLLEERVPVTT